MALPSPFSGPQTDIDRVGLVRSGHVKSNPKVLRIVLPMQAVILYGANETKGKDNDAMMTPHTLPPHTLLLDFLSSFSY